MGNICQISCDGALLNRGLDLVLGQSAYISGLQKNFDELEKELGKLIEAKNDLQRKVDSAELQQGMKRLETVRGWLSRVEAVKDVVDKLKAERSQETEKLCLGGYCSKSCFSSYKFGKQVAEKLREVQKLKNEGAFDPVAEKVPEPAVERPIEPKIIGQDAILDEIWGCLNGEEQVGIVGIYGMGGIGKTTLLAQIYNKFLGDESKNDVIKIWAKVSKDLKPGKIQEEIWKMIGVLDDSWKAKSLEDKRSDIYRNLSKKKFVLLLDDIWERVDIINIGVPIPNKRNGSKIIFTTRSIDVCKQMDARRKFKLNCLQETEARELFEEKVGEDMLKSDPEIRKLAGEMAKECCGLPLALITIGRAMANKKLEDWGNRLDLLRKSASHFQGMEKDVFRILKLSYDDLSTDTNRSCLLYCSLFPKHHRIDKDDLIDSWIGEGFFDETFGRALASDTISVLVDACLLEQEEDKEGSYVKLHGVIRDMALWIGCKLEKSFFVHAGYELFTPPENRNWEQVRRVSLMENYINSLSKSPRCPDLQTLFLSINSLGEISDDFFQLMASLRVLNLSFNYYLYKCPSGVAKLVSLQQLDLSHTRISRLPKELEALVNLICLNLDHTEELAEVPPGLISNFSRLQVLRMFACGHYTELWRAAESLVEELLGLKCLIVLTVTLKNIANFEAFQALLHKLKGRRMQSLLLYRFVGPSLDVLALPYLKRLNKLRISWCTYLEELKMDYAAEAVRKTRELLGFSVLQAVQIDNCRRLKDLTWLVFAPNLKNISVSDCSDLKEIITSEKLDVVHEMIPNQSPLRQLQYVDLKGLASLSNIYWKPLPFPDLKEIEVSKCPKLKKLPLNSNSAKGRNIFIKGEEDWWKNLEWEDQATKDVFLPCFQTEENNKNLADGFVRAEFGYFIDRTNSLSLETKCVQKNRNGREIKELLQEG